MDLKQKYEEGVTFEQFLPTAKKNADLWVSIHERAKVPDDLIARADALPARRYLLVISEDWCGDSVSTLPFIARLVERSATLYMRLVERDCNPQLMDSYLTNGSRSIPVVIVLDENFTELGWWGPRPSPLQKWVREEGLKLEKTERYREVRKWYGQDHGVTTLGEIMSLLEKTA